METNVSPDRASELILSAVRAPETEWLPLNDSLGRVLAEDAVARLSIPSFPKSPYDGYALMSDDVRAAGPASPVVLSVVEAIAAGGWPIRAITPGTAAKIATGAPIPAGADCVVKYESVEFTDTDVRLSEPVAPGMNIVGVGEDVVAGSCLVAAGTRLCAPALGMLAGQGYEGVNVYRQPLAGIVAVGSELTVPGRPLLPGRIYDSNTPTIRGYLSGLGFRCLDFGIVEDDPRRMKTAFAEAIGRVDLLVTTGGASVGEHDHIKSTFASLGASCLYWKTSMHPGGASMAHVLGGKPVLSLSGNPGAAVLALLRVALPGLRGALGRSRVELTRLTARLTNSLPKKSPKGRLLRGYLEYREGHVFFTENGGQRSSVLSSFFGCDALAEIAPGTPALEAGSAVSVLLVRDE